MASLYVTVVFTGAPVIVKASSLLSASAELLVNPSTEAFPLFLFYQVTADEHVFDWLSLAQWRAVSTAAKATRVSDWLRRAYTRYYRGVAAGSWSFSSLVTPVVNPAVSAAAVTIQLPRAARPRVTWFPAAAEHHRRPTALGPSTKIPLGVRASGKPVREFVTRKTWRCGITGRESGVDLWVRSPWCLSPGLAVRGGPRAPQNGRPRYEIDARHCRICSILR